MGVAALVIGIISFILALIPFCGFFAAIPALIGLGLGIAEVIVKGRQQLEKGMGIAGIILSSLAIVASLIWVIILVVLGSAAEDPTYSYSLFI
ncbi:hypothetical protein [Haloplasma contractile]|uniref:DUF4190 domain-containing protein n=1 Tax=Haloplasma contractile SSD-17B TaxID=1033810 RepID=U2E8H0_9MOLU|nr:hypothetical protein [Haloplasma contractile]ERJ11191.1 hypothetical protein HLPCO_002760 [Haloplasma contractile SSD-17B]